MRPRVEYEALLFALAQVFDSADRRMGSDMQAAGELGDQLVVPVDHGETGRIAAERTSPTGPVGGGDDLVTATIEAIWRQVFDRDHIDSDATFFGVDGHSFAAGARAAQLRATMGATIRAYAGVADLRAMQELTQRVWSPASRQHIGDLAWGRFMYTPDLEDWPIALWAGGRPRGGLGSLTSPTICGCRSTRRGRSWSTTSSRGSTSSPTAACVSSTPMGKQVELREALVHHGYEERENVQYFAHHARSLLDLPKPELTEGFTARAVRGEGDLANRVAGHQEV